MRRESKAFQIRAVVVLCALSLMVITGFEKYNNIQNPQQAFEKDLEQQNGQVSAKGTKNIINILLLGVDSTQAREARGRGYRSDAIVMANLDLDVNRVKLISIPRDTYTNVPGNDKKDKINHAMAFGGGPQKQGNRYAVKAVEGLLNTKIHYYVTMDLDAVKDIVDAIGGVTVDVERSMGSGTRRLEKGEQRLNGDQALVYLKNRSAPRGDFARIQQQQKFMLALFHQVKENSRFSDVLPLYLKIQNKIFTNLQIHQIGALVLFLKDLNPKGIEIFTLKGEDLMVDGTYYLDVDQDYIKEIMHQGS